ncbi:MAG: hypothetical protein M1834_000060 [Cirrosporium novae-zelandiae]|nr:MAG: hypothetical protein M1834_000060 [Cirrosporium novae-zelandiae]
MAIPVDTEVATKPYLVHLTNCRLVRGSELVNGDLWIDSKSGKIIDTPNIVDRLLQKHRTVNLHGKILAPGFIDVQINGWQGVDFSIPAATKKEFDVGLRRISQSLIKTGVTSFLPTMTSQAADVYHKILPSLVPSGSTRNPHDGTESLGAHVEGPFISPKRNGIHCSGVLTAVSNGISDLEDRYGATNLWGSSSNSARSSNVSEPQTPNSSNVSEISNSPSIPAIKMMTAAPEVGTIAELIPRLTSSNIVFSIGHSDATLSEATIALKSGATMVTHLFNAMRPFAHREPGIIGTLNLDEISKRPYFGIIADGIHNHPVAVRMAHAMRPEGMILVTDAMMYAGLDDGYYPWTNGEFVTKKGTHLILERTGGIAGSAVTLMDCVNNLLEWTNCDIAEAIGAVTTTPAKMLKLGNTKGSLIEGADADLVVLDDTRSQGKRLVVDQVWKFGVPVFNMGKTGK